MKDYWTVSEVAAAEYCQQKAVYDAVYGDTPNSYIQAVRERGHDEHRAFEKEGLARMEQDKRCFIASALYGPDADQADHLRKWRDKHLAPCRSGRMLLNAYYQTSLFVVRLADRLPCCKRGARLIVDQVVRATGGKS